MGSEGSVESDDFYVPPYEDLLIAGKRGDFNSVNKILSKTPSMINMQDKKGDTALMILTFAGKNKMVKYLVDKRPDFKIKNDEGCTIMTAAATTGNLEILRYVAKRGASIDQVDQDKNTLLHNAAGCHHLNVVKWLVKQGIDINVKNKKNATPLMCACKTADYEISKYLIKCGAEIINVNEGMNALVAAAMSGDVKIVQLLLENGADVNQASYNVYPVSYACKEQKKDILKLLVENGARVDIADQDGHLPLLDCAITGNTEMARILLQYGAEPDAMDPSMSLENRRGKLGYGDDEKRSYFNRTPLIWAAEHDNVAMMKVLIEYGSDIEQHVEFGFTPLIRAAFSRSNKALKYLIEQGAEIDAVDDEERTALNYAIQSPNFDGFKALIIAGADINRKDSNGKTILQYAAERDSPLFFSYLITKGLKFIPNSEDGIEILRGVFKYGSEQFITIILDVIGGDVNYEIRDKETPLMWSAFNNNIPGMQLLIERGAQVNAVSKLFGTALSFACVKPHIGAVDMLLRHGADVKLGGDKQPVCIAARMGHSSLIPRFLSAGGDGKAALRAALEGKHFGTALWLKDNGYDDPDAWNDANMAEVEAYVMEKRSLGEDYSCCSSDEEEWEEEEDYDGEDGMLQSLHRLMSMPFGPHLMKMPFFKGF